LERYFEISNRAPLLLNGLFAVPFAFPLRQTAVRVVKRFTDPTRDGGNRQTGRACSGRRKRDDISPAGGRDRSNVTKRKTKKTDRTVKHVLDTDPCVDNPYQPRPTDTGQNLTDTTTLSVRDKCQCLVVGQVLL